MEFREVLTARRSCRAFLPQGVDEQDLAYLLEALSWAPSPLNQQPWQVVVIDQPEAKARVKEVCQQALQRVIEAGGPGWVRKYGLEFLDQAPVLLAVLYDPRRGGLGSYFGQPHGALMAAAAGIQNLMLAATEWGLGTLWLTFFDPQQMRQALGVPPELEIAGVIPVGRPQGEIPTPPRRPVKVHCQRYQAQDRD